MAWIDEYEPEAFARERARQGLSQKEVSTKAELLMREQEHGVTVPTGGLAVRTISNIETGVASVGTEYLELYAAVLGQELTFFRRLLKYDPAKVKELLRLSRVAISRGYDAARTALERPWEIAQPITSGEKIGSHDETKRVDKSTSDAIWHTFAEAAEDPKHFLHQQGVYLVDEERGAHVLPAGVAPHYVIQIDSADDTIQFERYLAGSLLVSCYEIGVGTIAAAAADWVHGVVFLRGANGNTQASRLVDSTAPNSFEPSGTPVFLAPSFRRQLAGATLNVYLGKAYRVGLFAQEAPGLAARRDVNLLSYGGSRGALLTAQGAADAALEIRGMKLLDAIPGLYLAAGSSVYIEDLDKGRPFDFGIDSRLERIWAQPPGEWSDELEDHRVRFLVAATKELASEIKASIPACVIPGETAHAAAC